MRLRKRTAQALLAGALAAGLGVKAFAQSDTLTIGTSTATVTEGEDISITITRSADADFRWTLRIAVSGGSAFGLPDATTTHDVVWSLNEADTTLTFNTSGDDTDEPDGTVTFTLLTAPMDGVQYTVGTPASVQVTVQDDDEPAPAPAVTGVSISAPRSGDTFGDGEVIEVTVDYGVNLTVTGSPRLPLAIGETTRHALYSTPSDGTNPGRLVFRYTVQGGDNDADGISVPGPIDLAPGADGQNTAAIAAETGGTAATLTLGAHAIANNGNRKVSTGMPELTISTTLAANQAVVEGGDVPITVTRDSAAGTGPASFNVNFAVTVAEGDSKFGLPHSPSKLVDFANGATTASVVLSTTNDQLDNPGSHVTIALADGSSYSYTKGTNDSVTVRIIDDDLVPDPPTINSLSPTSVRTIIDDTDPDNVVTTTQTSLIVDFTLHGFGLIDGVAADLDLHVLELEVEYRCVDDRDGKCLAYDFETGMDAVNKDWTGVFHNFAGFSGDNPAFAIHPLAPDTEYEVRMRVVTQVGDGDWGTAEGRTFSDDPNNKTPVVTSLSINAPARDHTFYTGEEIRVIVEWDRELDVTGTPRLALWFGRTADTVKWADYSAADSHPAGLPGGADIVFKYRVQAGDESEGISIYDHVTIGGTAIQANGGTLKVHCSHLDINGGTLDGEQIVGNPDCVADALFASLEVGTGYAGTVENPLDPGHGFRDSRDHKVDGSADVTPPTPIAARVGGTTLLLIYDEPLDPDSVPTPDDFIVRVDGTNRAVDSVAVAGSTVTLTLASEVTSGQTVRLDYDVPTSNPIQDTAGNDALGITGTVTVDVRAPLLRWATVRDTTVALIYDEALDTGSVPAASAFTVTVDSTARTVNAVAVADSVVTLTLASAVTSGQTVTLDYAVPASNPIQDLVGNDAAALDDQAVTDATGTARIIPPISITSKPASGDTYGIGETITVEIGFAPPVQVRGTLDLDLEIGDYSRPTVCSDGGTAGHITVLSCSYTVQLGDIEDDGVFILGNNLVPRAGAAVNTVDNGESADLTFSTVRPDPMHKVNGGAIPPALETFRFDNFSTPSDGETFRAGETIRVLAAYRPRVDVTGTPRVGLRIGSQTQYADFVPFGDGGSDASVGTSDPQTWLFFDYTVQAGDLDENGIHVPAGSIDLNGGSIAGVVRETPAALEHPAIGTDASRKVNGGPARQGTSPPTGGGGGTSPPPSTGGGGTSSPPAVRTQLEPLTVAAGATADVDLRTAFRNARTFSAASSDPAAAAVEVTAGNVLRVTGLGRGFALVTVTAAGANGAEASQTMEVTVTGAARALLLPPASDELGRQGFVRIINHGDAAGEAAVEAIDDTGRSAGTVTVALPANGAAHFNSTDLEDGNPAKGIEAGVGPGLGNWRLAITSDLAFTALSYIRTRDGFVTSMHDAAPATPEDRRRIAFFNPASNWNQVSSLRLVNPGAERAQVTVAGVDDAGVAPAASVTLDVPAGGAALLTADELEAELGDGAGKWRLEAASDQPVAAMSLLSSPTGHLTNLSTIPVRPEDGRHLVPFLPPASDPHGRQGFVRVANRSGRDGTVTIQAFDDAGTDYGTLTLALDAGETAHFNTHDLEVGNPAKGLAGSAGPAVDGGWRLALESELALDVLAYVRHPDGFVTSMHDIAPEDGDGSWVAFLNPASNWRQVSRLRLVNPGEEDASVTLMGTDDAGASGRRFVFVTLPAGTSRTLSATDLEDGAEGIRGAFGDGRGKWRVRVSSRVPVLAMSLLESPTGHLTNLSTAPQRGAH